MNKEKLKEILIKEGFEIIEESRIAKYVKIRDIFRENIIFIKVDENFIDLDGTYPFSEIILFIRIKIFYEDYWKILN